MDAPFELEVGMKLRRTEVGRPNNNVLFPEPNTEWEVVSFDDGSALLKDPAGSHLGAPRRYLTPRYYTVLG